MSAPLPGPIPTRESIEREGWGTPAAQYLQEQMEKRTIERNLLLVACKLAIDSSDTGQGLTAEAWHAMHDAINKAEGR